MVTLPKKNLGEEIVNHLFADPTMAVLIKIDETIRVNDSRILSRSSWADIFFCSLSRTLMVSSPWRKS